MEKKRTVLAVAGAAVAAALLALALHGCNLFGVTIEQRISQFESDLGSNDRADIYLNFHPTLTTTYDQIKSEVWWDSTAYSTAYQPFSIEDVLANEDAGTATASFYSGAPVNGNVMSFTLAKDGANWQIVSVSITGVPGGSIN